MRAQRCTTCARDGRMASFAAELRRWPSTLGHCPIPRG
jgi:hypothetical protein